MIQTKKEFGNYEEQIKTTEASFSGKNTINFKIIVDRLATEEDAMILHYSLNGDIAKYSNHSALRDFYTI